MINQDTATRAEELYSYINEFIQPKGILSQVISTKNIEEFERIQLEHFPIAVVDERYGNARPPLFKNYISKSHTDESFILLVEPDIEKFRYSFSDFLIDQEYKIISLEDFSNRDRSALVAHCRYNKQCESFYFDWITLPDGEDDTITLFNCSILTAW